MHTRMRWKESKDAEVEIEEKAEEVEVTNDEHGKSMTRVHKAMEVMRFKEVGGGWMPESRLSWIPAI